jgi:SlyX protein
MKNAHGQSLADRLDELESRLAFQDDLIEQLNEVVSRQDRELARLALQVKALAAKVSDLSTAGEGPSHPTDYEVPPHY